MTNTNTDDVPFDALRNLKQVMDDGKVPQDQQVIMQIQACIEAGIVEGKRITGVLAHIGYTKRYVGKMLADYCGKEPARHCWYRDEEGAYRILVSLAG